MEVRYDFPLRHGPSGIEVILEGGARWVGVGHASGTFVSRSVGRDLTLLMVGEGGGRQCS
jgi:hypothetical protein